MKPCEFNNKKLKKKIKKIIGLDEKFIKFLSNKNMKYSIFLKNFSTCSHQLFKKAGCKTSVCKKLACKKPILRQNEELAKSYCKYQPAKEEPKKPMKFVPDRDNPDCIWCNKNTGFCAKYFKK